MRVRPSLRALLLGGLLWLDPHASRAAGCSFSNLEWETRGDALRFLAGEGQEVRRLRVDVASGELQCLDPQVHEPGWDAALGRVLFRDLFGVFEVEPRSGAEPRLRLFLPSMSAHFLRAFGTDGRGQLLVWTYDRIRAEHVIWTQASAGLQPLPGRLSGSEALKVWESRNRTRPFAQAGGQYVRSTCVTRPHTEKRFCLENVPLGRGGRSPFFRLTLGSPGNVEVLQDRCAPGGLAVAPDTSRVVVGLFEDLDAAGRSQVLAVWISDWATARRAHEALLPRAVDVRLRQRSWAHWLAADELLWADASGQLLGLKVRNATATPLVAAASPAVQAPLYRVVALEAESREAAEAARERLRADGFEAALGAVGSRFEVQVAAAGAREAAAGHADGLRRRGWPAEVREGPVDALAPGLSFAGATAPGGRTAFVRQVEDRGARFSEIWLAEGEAPARLLVPAFSGRVPSLPAGRPDVPPPAPGSRPRG